MFLFNFYLNSKQTQVQNIYNNFVVIRVYTLGDLILSLFKNTLFKTLKH